MVREQNRGAGGIEIGAVVELDRRGDTLGVLADDSGYESSVEAVREHERCESRQYIHQYIHVTLLGLGRTTKPGGAEIDRLKLYAGRVATFGREDTHV